MKTEKVVLSFLALLIGIGVAGGAYYLYQTTQIIPVSNSSKKQNTVKTTPSEKKEENIFTISNPKDEEVFDQKTISISGNVQPNATVVIITPIDEVIVKPTTNGQFTTTATLEDGQNQIEFTAIMPDGTEKKLTRTVTFTTEEF